MNYSDLISLAAKYQAKAFAYYGMSDTFLAAAEACAKMAIHYYYEAMIAKA